MRLFAGIEIPLELREELERLIEGFRPAAAVQWSSAKNLHITTKFIGEWPAERLEEMKLALAAVPKCGPIQIGIRGLGWFPNPHNPRVFWAGVQAAESLGQLARDTEEAAASLGIAKERRPFSPHLTLARIKTPTSVAALRDAVAKLPSADFGSFTARRFYLYLSETRPTGSVYTKLEEFPIE